jgi:hypothetical protein
MTKKLSKAQKEKLIWYYKDGVRLSYDLSIGQREVIEEMKIYEDMDSDIDRFLEELKEKNY